MFIVQVEGCVKECFVGVCPSHDTFIIDDMGDPRENTLIKSEDNIKLGVTVSILKDKLRMQTKKNWTVVSHKLNTS